MECMLSMTSVIGLLSHLSTAGLSQTCTMQTFTQTHASGTFAPRGSAHLHNLCKIQRMRCRAAGKPAVAQDPFADKTIYNDSPVDKMFIKLFTQKMADQLGPGVHVPKDATYDDFVRVSKEIMRGRSTDEQRTVVRQVLKSLMPEQAPGVFRQMFPTSKWSAEINATVASLGFYWLVGDSELRAEPVEILPGVFREQRSVVHIKKCRYLENSGCVGMCINMCKVPTQNFFTQEFGLPLTMNPDFENLSCNMIFGQMPPPIDQDAAFQQPCFVPQCSLAQKSEPCPKTDTARDRGSGSGSSTSSSSNGSSISSRQESAVATAVGSNRLGGGLPGR